MKAQWAWFGAAVVSFVVLGCGGSSDDDDQVFVPGDAGGTTGDSRGPGAGGSGGSAGRPGTGKVTSTKPGSLVVTSPKRGEFVTRAGHPMVTVAGTGASSQLMINGQHVVVAADGSFNQPIEASSGLNLAKVIDGADEVDTPFLYGDYKPKATTIEGAVGLRVNGPGIDSSGSALSLGSILREALASENLVAPLVGVKFEKDSLNATVSGAKYDSASLTLSPRQGGVHVKLVLKNVTLTGPAKFKVSFISSPTFHFTLSTDATIDADVDVKYSATDHEASASIPSKPLVVLNKTIKFDTSIPVPGIDSAAQAAINFFRGDIADAVASQVQQKVGPLLQSELVGFQFDHDFDLHPHLDAALSVDGQLDGASFDSKGALIQMGGDVDADFTAGGLGSKAPGWLALSKPASSFAASSPIELSLAIDVVNQALFAVWGQGGLTFDLANAPLLGALHFEAMMPPVVVVAADGSALDLGVGELVATGQLNGAPFKVAITATDTATLSVDASGPALKFAVGDTPDLSLTWLEAGNVEAPLRDAIKSAAGSYLASSLPAISIPLPALPLDALPGLKGKKLVVASGATVKYDATTSRVTLDGDFAMP